MPVSFISILECTASVLAGTSEYMLKWMPPPLQVCLCLSFYPDVHCIFPCRYLCSALYWGLGLPMQSKWLVHPGVVVWALLCEPTHPASCLSSGFSAWCIMCWIQMCWTSIWCTSPIAAQAESLGDRKWVLEVVCGIPTAGRELVHICVVFV